VSGPVAAVDVVAAQRDLANFWAAKLTSLVAFEHEKTPKVVPPWAAFAAVKPSTTF
jgi:hypothetical protein